MLGIKDPDEDYVHPAKIPSRDGEPSSGVAIREDPLLAAGSEPSLEPPDQKELFRRSITPRHHVEIVLDEGGSREETEVRQSLIEDIDEQGRLLLAQTSPPFLRSQRGRMIEPTFLSRFYDVPGGRWLRVGYRTPVLDIDNTYRLSSGRMVTVVIVDPPEELKPVTVRMDYRVEPPPDLDLRLVLWPEGTRLELLDFSSGGLQFQHDPRMEFRERQPVNLALVTGDLSLLLPSRVVRTMTKQLPGGREIGVASVRFDDVKPETMHKFRQLVHSTYRHLLALRSGIQEPE